MNKKFNTLFLALALPLGTRALLQISIDYLNGANDG